MRNKYETNLIKGQYYQIINQNRIDIIIRITQEIIWGKIAQSI